MPTGVTPAKAGVQKDLKRLDSGGIPAFAGVSAFNIENFLKSTTLGAGGHQHLVSERRFPMKKPGC